MSQTVELLEYTRVTQARQVDEDKGILYDLALLGPSSENGRDYPESTQKAMLPMLEGRQSFADHSKNGADPSIYHVLGVWRNCRVVEGKTRGDFHYFKSHKLAPTLVEAARRPELNNALGFSINARGRTRFEGGRQIVEGVDKVISVDCVAQPATLAGLYESRNQPVKKKLRDLIESLKVKRPLYAKALSEMAEAGVMSPDATMDEPPMDAPAAPADHKTALMDALKALCDEADTLDEGELMKKFKAILKLIKGDSGGGGGGGGEPDGDEPMTAESRRLKAENGQLLAEKLVRKAAGAAKVAITEALVEALARPGMTSAQAEAVVAELKGGGTPAGGGGQRPKSAGPIQPTPASGKGGGLQESKLPEASDPKAMGRWLSGRN